MDEAQFLFNHYDYLELDNIFSTMARHILWKIITFLRDITKFIPKSLEEILGLHSIFENETYIEFINMFSSVALGIGILSLVVYGVRYIIDREIQLKSIFDNILLGTGTTLLGTYIIIQLTTLTFNLSHAIIVENGEYSDQLISNHMLDMEHIIANQYLFDKNTLTTEEVEASKLDINDNNIKFIDIGANIYTEDFDKDVQKALEKRIDIDANGEPQVREIMKIAWIEIPQKYYRYHWRPMNIILSLAGTSIAYALFAFKIVQLLFEIIFNQTILPLFAFEDLNKGKALKTIITNIKNALVTIVLSSLIIRVYQISLFYLNEFEVTDITNFIVQIALLLAVVDGPVIIERMTGYDGGVKSTGHAVLATGAGTIATVKGTGKTLKSGWNLTKSTGSGLKSGYDRINNYMRDRSSAKGNIEGTAGSSAQGNKSQSSSDKENYINQNLVKDSRVQHGSSGESQSNSSYHNKGSEPNTSTLQSSIQDKQPSDNISLDNSGHAPSGQSTDHASSVSSDYQGRGSENTQGLSDRTTHNESSDNISLGNSGHAPSGQSTDHASSVSSDYQGRGSENTQGLSDRTTHNESSDNISLGNSGHAPSGQSTDHASSVSSDYQERGSKNTQGLSDRTTHNESSDNISLGNSGHAPSGQSTDHASSVSSDYQRRSAGNSHDSSDNLKETNSRKKLKGEKEDIKKELLNNPDDKKEG